ncbi:hypothetical protein Cni_G11480 [Canna indica]|uniref:Uncharacterized protein n=1 Tax=Canna indica TaxID=4628 RepID=A0AAQ3QAX0_9LILI|nr:hypothetical protein Cni_G11480 [Canna indica]
MTRCREEAAAGWEPGRSLRAGSDKERMRSIEANAVGMRERMRRQARTVSSMLSVDSAGRVHIQLLSTAGWSFPLLPLTVSFLDYDL